VVEEESAVVDGIGGLGAGAASRPAVMVTDGSGPCVSAGSATTGGIWMEEVCIGIGEESETDAIGSREGCSSLDNLVTAMAISTTAVTPMMNPPTIMTASCNCREGSLDNDEPEPCKSP